jgi:hypothetical protein
MDAQAAAQKTDSVPKIHIAAILPDVAIDRVESIANLPGVRDVVIANIVATRAAGLLGRRRNDRLCWQLRKERAKHKAGGQNFPAGLESVSHRKKVLSALEP